MIPANDLRGEIDGIIKEPWNIRNGQVVPTVTDVQLSGAGVKLDATILFTDLADSTWLVMHDRAMSAKIFKAFLACATRLIRDNGGEIRSFDGDRVMGVFLGAYKNSSAVKCALQINWMFVSILKPKFEAQFAVLRDGTHKLAHCTGIDTGEVLVVRSGVRNNNDLIWVGGAANIAAKLSALREPPYHSYISSGVYARLSDEAKLSQGQDMWEERGWTAGPISKVYRSSYWWVLA